MKLLHITATHLNPIGGIPVVLKNLTDAQNRIEGFEAKVLSVSADVNLIDSPYFSFLGNQSFSDYLDVYKPDVVIFHSHYYLKYLKLYPFCLKRNIPYFIEPHGSFGKNSLKKSRWKKVVANYIVFRRFMKKAKGFVFLNQSEQSKSRFRTPNDIIIPNGIDLSHNTFVECDENKILSFYYIGRYDINHKGLDCLFDALDILEKKNKSIQFDFYGEGTLDAESYLKKRSEKYKNIHVRFNSPIYGQNQDKELNQKGIMVLISRYEGFPMTILEAWKYGNPCLVTDGTNVAEETVKNKLGWRTEFSPESIANTMEYIVEDYQANKEEYLKKCKEYVFKNYTWDKIAKMSFSQLNKYI